jgi:hypothetical protein
MHTQSSRKVEQKVHKIVATNMCTLLYIRLITSMPYVHFVPFALKKLFLSTKYFCVANMFSISQHAKHTIATTSNITSKTHPVTSLKTLSNKLINSIKRFMYAISRKVKRIELKRRKRKERKQKKTKGEKSPPFFSHPCVGVK